MEIGIGEEVMSKTVMSEAARKIGVGTGFHATTETVKYINDMMMSIDDLGRRGTAMSTNIDGIRPSGQILGTRRSQTHRHLTQQQALQVN